MILVTGSLIFIKHTNSQPITVQLLHKRSGVESDTMVILPYVVFGAHL